MQRANWNIPGLPRSLLVWNFHWKRNPFCLQTCSISQIAARFCVVTFDTNDRYHRVVNAPQKKRQKKPQLLFLSIAQMQEEQWEPLGFLRPNKSCQSLPIMNLKSTTSIPWM